MEKTASGALNLWLNTVMADKVMFTAVIDKKLAKEIGLADNTADNLIRIIKNAAKELIGKELATGRISNILVQKNGGLWKIAVFKEKLQKSIQNEN